MTGYFKQSVLNLLGYTSPPQKEFRVKLNQNESPFDVPHEIKDELAEAAKTLEWNRYPVNESPALLQKLAERHEVEPNHILLGNGSNQLFQTLLTATLKPGDRVVSTPPTFSLYDLYSTIYDAKQIDILHAPGTDYPYTSVLAAIQEHNPKLVFVCSPNNPTGYEVDLDLVAELCKACDGLVFFDEAYGEFSLQTAMPLLEEYDNLIISRTFSKAFSMAGLRFGYFIARPDIIAQLRKVNIPYNVNIFTELVALRLLDEQENMHEHVSFLIQERRRLYHELEEIPGVTVFRSAANFLLFRGLEHLNLFQALKERGVLVRDVSSYPLLEGYSRVSVGYREENDLFLDTLKSIMNSL